MLKKQIELLRREKGWSQAELANRIHISPSAIGMYEQGRREPHIKVLIALSKEFDVTIDFLVTGTHRASAVTEVNFNKEPRMGLLPMLRNLSREELIVLLTAQIIAP